VRWRGGPSGWSVPLRASRVVPGRAAAGALAVVGLLLAATTAVWPTRALVLTTAEVGEFHRVLRTEQWSWGRELSVAENGATYDAASGPPNLVALVVLCTVLALALAGVVTWLVVPGRTGEVAGPAGIAAGLATVAQSWAARVASPDASRGLVPGLTSQTLPAGHLESVAGALLGVALLLALRPALVASAARAWRTVAEAVERGRADERRRDAERDDGRDDARDDGRDAGRDDGRGAEHEGADDPAAPRG